MGYDHDQLTYHLTEPLLYSFCRNQLEPTIQIFLLMQI